MSDWDPVLEGGSLVAFAPVTDLERAAAFYSRRLGLPVLEQTPQACVVKAPNAVLRLTLVPELTPHPFTILGWEVDDIDRAVAALTARGIHPLDPPAPDVDERGIWTAPDGGRVWWFTDPDRNVLSLTQPAAT